MAAELWDHGEMVIFQTMMEVIGSQSSKDFFSPTRRETLQNFERPSQAGPRAVASTHANG